MHLRTDRDKGITTKYERGGREFSWDLEVLSSGTLLSAQGKGFRESL